MKDVLKMFFGQWEKHKTERKEEKEGGEKKSGQNRHIGLLALICMIGIVLLLVPEKEGKEQTEPMSDIAEYRQETENRLSHMLSHVHGVGKAEVMILFRDEGRTYFAADGEESRSDNTEKISESYVLKNSGSGVQTPLVEQKCLPEAEGVFVIAQGAERADVRENIIGAVHAVLGVPSHRIEVLIKK